jgi:hypothetical protein
MRHVERLLAIDPGPTQSGFVVVSPDVDAPGGLVIEQHRTLPNTFALLSTMAVDPSHVVIEMVQSYGAPVGADTFETCVWIGRFIEALDDCREPVRRIYRPTVLGHVCLKRNAKSSQVFQALKDRFGPPGTKKRPGPLYKVGEHERAALALGIAYLEGAPLVGETPTRPPAARTESLAGVLAER